MDDNELKTRLDQQMRVNEVLLTRMKYASLLGQSYDGSRDLYKVLGYPQQLNYSDYYMKYKRADIAKVLIDKLPKACWATPPLITDEQEGSKFQAVLEELISTHSLFQTMLRADKLLGLGEYAVLLLGFSDVQSISQMASPVAPGASLDLLYVQPYGGNACQIKQENNDPTSPRFGMPELYQIDPGAEGLSKNQTVSRSFLVHHSRIIHLAEDCLENTIKGTPRLQALFNRLEDIQKILGGSGEMYWRGGISPKVATAKEGYTFGNVARETLQTQMDEYEHNLRRLFTLDGLDLSNLDQQVHSPVDFLNAQLMMISIVTGIPKRILLGSERGELASSQDQDQWNDIIHQRQIDICGPVFLRPLISRLIEYQVLPEPMNGVFFIYWSENSAIGEKEKSEITLNRTKALKEYVSAPGADMMYPPELWLREELGLDQQEIDEIQEMLGQAIGLEDEEEPSAGPDLEGSEE